MRWVFIERIWSLITPGKRNLPQNIRNLRCTVAARKAWRIGHSFVLEKLRDEKWLGRIRIKSIMSIDGMIFKVSHSVMPFRPFFNRAVETCNFDPRTLILFSNVSLHLTLWFFSIINRGPETLHTPLHTFSIFGPSTFGFCSQSAREVSKSLKIGEKGLQVRWMGFMELKLAHGLP